MNYYLIYIILGAAILGLFSWLMILIFKENEEEGDDVIIDAKLVPSITRGYADLIQKDVQYGKSGRLLITALARDIDSKKIAKEGLKLPITIKFAVPPELIETLPKGDCSKDRHHKIILPRNAKDIPASIRNTSFGLAWATYVESKNRDRAMQEILTKDNKSQTLIAERLTNNHLFDEYTKSQESFKKAEIESMKELKKPASSFNPVKTNP